MAMAGLSRAAIVQAAIPAGRATIAVSATVVASCDNTACGSLPHVISYSPASGDQDQPAFGMFQAAGMRVMTITY